MKIIKSTKTKDKLKVIWFLLIIFVATMAGMFCSWRFSGLNLYAQDLLMRTRGTMPVPKDIVIVAIDEASIEKLGQFPWSRDLTAKVIEKLTTAKPKVIALNILYSEPTDTDEALSNAIKKSGKVIVGEQLIQENYESAKSVWLKALPEIEKASAGIGHVNVATEQDGAARELFMRLADDEGKTRWALAVETVRIGDNFEAEKIKVSNQSISFGSYKIPFIQENQQTLPLNLIDGNSEIIVTQPHRMIIDYIGPTGSFSSQTYSFADVLEGRVSLETFRDKYVLIGATAATLGDKISTPFVHFETEDGNQNGEFMSGIEILANSVNTILRRRFYQPVSDLTAAFFAALVAIGVLLLLRLAEGKFEAAKQIGVLVGLGVLILFGCYFVYVNFLIIPPAVPMLVSFVVATPLALLNRSLTASAGIDERINELLAVEKTLLTNKNDKVQKNDREGVFPHGIEWKTQTLKHLSNELIGRSLFVDRALRSLDEALLIAEPDGCITFANQKAAEIIKIPESRLIGENLFSCIEEIENESKSKMPFTQEGTSNLLVDGNNIKCEIAVGKSELKHYDLNLSIVNSSENEELLGVIATLTDITHHRELQQTKNDIITLVTHELRTPLTAIQGMSEVLSEHEVEAESQTKMLQTINLESKRLARMINDYLDITRIESGKQKVNFYDVDVKDLLERTLTVLEPLAVERNIKISSNFEPTLPYIFADEEMLVQAFTNLVNNAIKYSPSESDITLKVKVEDEFLKVIVTDEGEGISDEHLPHIFDKFYRVPNRNTADIPGTGLGLALTGQIIELHGGRIEVESRLKFGSTFTVFLPLTSED